MLYVYNNSSDYVHQVTAEDPDSLVCNKAFPKDFTRMSEPPVGAQKCHFCF